MNGEVGYILLRKVSLSLPGFQETGNCLTLLCGVFMYQFHKSLSINMERMGRKRPPLWSSGQSFWLQIQRSRVRFPALPDFLSSSGSGTGPTQPREVN